MTQNPTTEVEVCICTYRRAALSDAVQSVLAQDLPEGIHLSILVIDNDTTPSAQALVDALAEDTDIPLRYAHRPAGNISIARNGALELSTTRYLAFLDDDEVATPGWLHALLDVATKTSAEVVLGPVTAIYAADAALWMRELDLHSTRPTTVSGAIQTGYTCNVLIDRHSAALEGLNFDLALGRSGGEDTVFFAEVYRRGGRIVEAPDALVQEAVPEARASLTWLARRRFRMGQTHARLLRREGSRLGQIGEVALAAAKVAYCAGAAGLSLASRQKRNGAILRGCLHAGTIAGLIGAAPLELYGANAQGAVK